MYAFSRRCQPDTDLAIGWISTTDMFLLLWMLTAGVVWYVWHQADQQRLAFHQAQANWQNETAGLQEQLQRVQTQQQQILQENQHLTEKAKKLAELATMYQKTSAHWAQQAHTLTEQLQKLKEELATKATSQAALKKQLEQANDFARKAQHHSQKLEEENRFLRQQLATAQQAAEEGKIQLATAIQKYHASQQRLKDYEAKKEAEPGLHKALVGLKGNLGRVAFVVDTSGSMGFSGRWQQAQEVVATWLEHLAIRECVLILFSDGVQIFPQDGTFLPVHGPDGRANRQRLLEQIRTTQPEGRTNTLLALQTAYRYPGLDTIILFTDGEPNRPTNTTPSGFDPEVAEEIYQLVQKHRHIPINAVGLGDYFKPELSGFLLKLAQQTNGCFLGR
ncbi:MAG: VWA domain-containing protein [Thermoguttaceae bacterium]|nr:VWA domain-containing protein [Thermoguttaceae bacterium]MDW8038394.1 VWA domain-containing protein [Thermoguttaceae bacterium]